MAPTYDYSCEYCETEIDVLRKLPDSGVLPSEEEEGRLSNSRCEKAPVEKKKGRKKKGAVEEKPRHKWKRIHKKAPGIAYGGNWGAGKGYWAIPLLLPALTELMKYL